MQLALSNNFLCLLRFAILKIVSLIIINPNNTKIMLEEFSLHKFANKQTL